MYFLLFQFFRILQIECERQDSERMIVQD